MASGPITPDRLTEYRQKGYMLVRRMFNSQEIDLLRRSAKQDKTLDDHAFGRDDGRGKIVRLSLWNHPGDTIYGMFARCESIVNSAERILDGEVYHYHSKMIMKDAKTGGAWPGIRITVTGIRMASFHPISAAHPLLSIQPLAKTAAFRSSRVLICSEESTTY